MNENKQAKTDRRPADANGHITYDTLRDGLPDVNEISRPRRRASRVVIGLAKVGLAGTAMVMGAQDKLPVAEQAMDVVGHVVQGGDAVSEFVGQKVDEAILETYELLGGEVPQYPNYHSDPYNTDSIRLDLGHNMGSISPDQGGKPLEAPDGS